jgi:DNA polymerase-3 subunit beta
VKLSVTRDSFKEVLDGLYKIVEKKSTFPVLSHLHLRTDEDILEVCATDLNIRKSVRIEAIIDEPGEALLPATILRDMVSAASLERIEIETIGGHRVAASAGEYLVKISGLDPAEFPQPPADAAEETIEIEAKDLQDMVNACGYAASRDDSKCHISGVRLSSRAGIAYATATDGNRLSVAGKRLHQALSLPVTVPVKGMEEILRLDDAPVSVTRGERYIGLTQGGMSVTIRLQEGEFPDVARVIRSESPVMVTLDGPDFLAAVKRTALFGSKQKLTLSIQKTFIILSAGNSENEATDSVECDLHGDPLDISFNARYLIEALSALPVGDIFLNLCDETSAVVIIPGNMAGWDERLCVIMPMRS